MFTIPPILAAILGIVGIILMFAGILASGVVLGQESDPLRDAALSRAQRVKIRTMVIRGEFVADQEIRPIVTAWAAREATTGARALKWRAVFYPGFTLVLSFFYLIPGATSLTILAQVLILLFGIVTIMSSWRGVRNSRILAGMAKR